jgi:hypothetical protein
MLTEQTIEIGIEQSGLKIIHLISAQVVLRDGVEIARTKVRTAFPPGSDVSSAPVSVQALAALWTQADIDAYRALGQPEDA